MQNECDMVHNEKLSSENINLPGRMFILFCLLFAVFLVLLFLGIPQVRADTEVGGPITEDTTWTLAGSPYIVATESVTVTQGVTLTIEPGVVVRFNQGSKMWVEGILDARGTEIEPIVFTSTKANPEPGDWGNIEFLSTTVPTIVDPDGNYISGSILQYCVVEYAGFNYLNAVYSYLNTLMVDNCIIENNRGTGIFIVSDTDTSSWITNNILSNNNAPGHGGGILLYYGVIMGNIVSNNSSGGGADGGGIYALDADIIDNMVIGNETKQTPSTEGGGIYSEYSSSGTFVIQGNLIQDNSMVRSGGGLYIKSNNAGAEVVVEENLISGNAADGNGGGIFLLGLRGEVTIRDNTLSDNQADSDQNHSGNGGGIHCDHRDGTYILQDNVITENSAGDSGGGIFTDICQITGNLVSNNIALNLGGGIVSSGDVLSNTISDNIVTSAAGIGAGVYLIGDGDFRDNSIVGNTAISGTFTGGLEITGTPEVHHNNLYGNNPYDVVVQSAQEISGTNNYWDTDVPSEIEDSIFDNIDDPSLGEFIYDPFLINPEREVPLSPPTGLTATLVNDQVELDWDSDPDFPDGWGYKVYYDTDTFLPPFEGQDLEEGESPIDVGGQTNYTLSGLEPYIEYYFGVTVYDDTGRESWYSIVMVDQPGPEPEPTPTPTPDPVENPPIFYLPIVWR